KNSDFIAILEYSVSKEDIVNLPNIYKVPVVVYVHHLREPVDEEEIFYYNPVAQEEPGKKWPATTWVLKKYLDLKVNDLIVMGIAGDLEERFLPAGFDKFPEIKSYLKGSKEKYMRYVRAKNLIDIHYKENDTELLKKMALRILKLKGNPEKIENIKKWHKKEENHKKELKKIIESSPDDTIGNIAEIYMIHTGKNVISAVTRRLAAKTEYLYVIVVNRGFFKDKSQIYVRLKNGIEERDTSVFKEIAGSLGAQAGGKDKVAGIIIDDKYTDEFLRKIKRYYE
ncbi:MAG: hypothetical protein PF545_06030, partial [Elusimicrobia bacterium]|nr:hypothetical protein [Elusimicrobiota bacterium]